MRSNPTLMFVAPPPYELSARESRLLILQMASAWGADFEEVPR